MAIASTICAAHEIYPPLEKEVLHLALRTANFAATVLNKNVPNYGPMRGSITKLCLTDSRSSAHDVTLMELMREVMRHVADEEAILLPMADHSFLAIGG